MKNNKAMSLEKYAMVKEILTLLAQSLFFTQNILQKLHSNEDCYASFIQHTELTYNIDLPELEEVCTQHMSIYNKIYCCSCKITQQHHY